MAPVLCNMFFLSAVDRRLHSTFNGSKVLKVFRYVDDFLVVFRSWILLISVMVVMTIVIL